MLIDLLDLRARFKMKTTFITALFFFATALAVPVDDATEAKGPLTQSNPDQESSIIDHDSFAFSCPIYKTCA